MRISYRLALFFALARPAMLPSTGFLHQQRSRRRPVTWRPLAEGQLSQLRLPCPSAGLLRIPVPGIIAAAVGSPRSRVRRHGLAEMVDRAR